MMLIKKNRDCVNEWLNICYCLKMNEISSDNWLQLLSLEMMRWEDFEESGVDEKIKKCLIFI
jgi:hypothetical protein